MEKPVQPVAVHDDLLERLVERVTRRVAELVVERLAPSLAPPAIDDHLLDVKEAAAHLRLSPSTLYKLSSTGQITKVKLGGHVRFRRRDLDEYAECHRCGEATVVELARQVRSPRR